ncbi:MAG: ferritin [Lentisphaerae bacterium]|jgi:ferritin|nr:ferritin [Lentisphaerota bacterium]MBT4821651.1 ferritin [Lentisphaerota bacterium]MBT5612905.1 ferritin [Lentisphaerota bacterium]MBT7060949.1 ferritin [Lentisphaerota bacterium]MBT7846974.1 ferritin [Lentisphaerota bacterium]
MLKKEILDALNDQMGFEMYSANIYLSMATWFDEKNLTGFANWMKVQYEEEMFHARKFYHYISERGGRVIIPGFDAPATEWDSPLAAFENALEHEELVTSRINNIVATASEAKDFATLNALQWFVAEQVEEEANVDGIIQQLKLMAGAPGALFMLDRELGQRVYTPPADSAE